MVELFQIPCRSGSPHGVRGVAPSAADGCAPADVASDSTAITVTSARGTVSSRWLISYLLPCLAA